MNFSSYVAVERKNKCTAIYLLLLRRERNFFGPVDSLVYDRAAMLYSLRKLPIEAGPGDGEVGLYVLARCVLFCSNRV